MHELALAQQTARIVARAAKGQRVRTVEVEIGHLRQVVPTALTSAWQFVVNHTALEGSELRTKEIPVELACNDCGATSTIGHEMGFHCRACASEDTRIVHGEEFRVIAIEVDRLG